MSTNQSIRTRSDRVANLQIETFWMNFRQRLAEPGTLIRLGLVFSSALLILVGVQGWNPPFSYRQGQIPSRAIMARVYFEVTDKSKTDALKAQAAREVVCYYENRNQPLIQLRGATKDQLIRLRGNVKYSELSIEQLDTLKKFLPANEAEATISPQDALASIQIILADESQLERLDLILRSVLAPIEETGLLRNLAHRIDEGNQAFIRVFESGQESKAVDVEVPRVRIAEVNLTLRESLLREFRREFEQPDADRLAGLVANFLQSQLTDTLTLREDLTQQARSQRESEIPPAKITYFPSKTLIAPAGRPLRMNDIDILRAEYHASLDQLTWVERSTRLFAFIGMVVALFLLCGLFFHYQFDRSLIIDSWKLARLLGLSTLCFLLCSTLSHDPWRAELLPLVVCAATATIAYGRNVTLVLLTALALGTTLALGLDLAKFVVMMSAGAATTLLLGRIRSRTRLIYVTATAAVVTAATTIGVGIMAGQLSGLVSLDEAATAGMSLIGKTDISSADGFWMYLGQLFKEAGQNAAYTVLAGSVMSWFLPFVEKIFAVQTDLRLLELGDPSHPLLRQLAQRAPGTYNHSINVAAIAEAAADSIGANGLLTRVGAYFHDIGKMFKPTYFIENQAIGENRHDSLQPAMSTLVIIAHVKDGADLARQHRLPRPIIDFIEQHHGTTLVEYFYRKEAKKQECDPDGEEVSEVTFRYPGPKPQTHESAILMLADAVESASRTLIEPTPTRLQNLIDQIAMKRLTDGQFDECGLTLSQLTTVKHSLLKSLTAIYHGRIKYSEQTA